MMTLQCKCMQERPSAREPSSIKTKLIPHGVTLSSKWVTLDIFLFFLELFINNLSKNFFFLNLQLCLSSTTAQLHLVHNKSLIHSQNESLNITI